MIESTGLNRSTGLLDRLNINRWLVWKEMRQLAPLVIALVVVALVMTLAQTSGSSYFGWQSNQFGLPLLVIPGLFATGAGAMLVGQERDQGTLHWMASLPVSPKGLVLIKFAVAFVGLLAVWLLVGLLIMLFGSSPGSPDRWRFSGAAYTANASIAINYPGFFLHSTMVLMAGFLCSWKIKNLFHALIALVFLAVVPLLMSQGYDYLARQTGYLPFLSPSAELTTWLITSIVLTVVYGLCAYRAAIKSLLPQPAPRIRGGGEEYATPYAASLESRQIVGKAPEFGTQVAPVIWQSIRSSKFTLFCLFDLLILGIIGLSFAGPESGPLTTMSAFILTPLAISWLGVFVFKNDGGSKRIKFLADRGVDCGSVFWGRHAAPIGLIAVALLFYVGLVWNSEETFLGLPLAFLLAAVIYSVSQWVSQLFRGAVVAAVLAPIASWMAVMWGGIYLSAFDAPLWVVIAMIALPLVASRWMMPRYMDQRDRPAAFLAVGAVVAMVFATPFIVTIYRFSVIEKMPAEQRTRLLAEAQKWSVPWDRSEVSLGKTLKVAMHAHLTFRDAVESSSEHPLEDFQPVLESIAGTVHGLRQSDYWRHQDAADRLEIWLIDVLNSKAMQPYREEDFFRRIADQLPTSTQRAADRRRAVLASWLEWKERQGPKDNDVTSHPSRNEMGGFEFLKLEMNHQVVKAGLLLEGYLERIVLVALQAAKASESDKDWLATMHREVISETLPQADGPYGERFRSLPAIKCLRLGPVDYPARYWGMPWEKSIDDLKASIKKANVAVTSDVAPEESNVQ